LKGLPGRFDALPAGPFCFLTVPLPLRQLGRLCAATAGTITEAPRDLPNVPADRQALGLVRPYLGMVTWPTVFVAIAIVAAFATVTTLGAMHIIRCGLA